MNVRRERHLSLVPAAPPNTASINIRLSKKATEANLSLAGMEADCRALCARYGLDVRYVHIDEQSGAIRDRKGFLAWLADGREGRVDTLVTFHVDRMTREGTNVAAMILDVVEGKDAQTGKVVRHPVRLLDCNGLDSEGDDTAFRMRLVIEAEVARAERQRMAKRSKDMHRRFAAEGKRTGPPPYGFQYTDGNRLIPLPEQAANLRRAAEQVWLIGTPAGNEMKQTVGSVVRYMNSPLTGFKPQRAKAWSRTTVIQCLSNTPAATEVDIFTPDERASLRSILAPTPGGKSTAPTGRRGSRIASGGLLECPFCGRVMHIHPRVRTGTKQKVDDYRCSAPPGACSHSVAVFADFMDDHLEAKFLFEYGDQPEYERRATVTGYAAVEEAGEAVAAALRALEKDASAEHFAALQLAQIQRAEAEAIPQTAEVRVVPTGRTIREAWRAADMPTKQQMLRSVWTKILLGPGKQGQRSLDLSRLTFVGRPAYVDGVHDTVTYVPGSVVVVAEPEDQAAARDREVS